MKKNLRLKDLPFESRAYKIYKEEEKFATLQRTLYEKACSFATRIFTITPDKKSRKKLKEAIDFSHIKITPEGVASLTILIALLVCIPTIALMATSLAGLPGLTSRTRPASK